MDHEQPPTTEKVLKVESTQASDVDVHQLHGGWDGPNDPQNPQNWTAKQMWTQVALISAMTIVTPLGSSMFAPGIPKIMREFNETSSTIATFVVSVYILGFAFGPLVVAPLSELYGRKHLYNYGNVLFMLCTIATALSQNMNMMLAFRFLMGLSGAVPVTIGSGTIADMMPVEQRGSAMSAWALGPLLGPCIGPVAGGYLIQAAGWRWVFWLVAILGGIFTSSFFLLKETYAPTILEHKRRQAAQSHNDDSISNTSSIIKPEKMASTAFATAIFRPMSLLVLEPLVTVSAFYVAVVYGILYLLIATFSFVYTEKYGFDEGSIGLAFLPAGIGMMLGVGTFGPLADYMVKRQQALGLPVTPEARLSPVLVLPCTLLLPLGLFVYGWTIESHIHFLVPMLGVMLFCFGLMGVMMCLQNYLLDSYPHYAASATAALAVLRSIAGALLPLGGLDLYDALGYGWGNSLLAFVVLALIPVPLIFFKFGPQIRSRSSRFQRTKG